MTYREILKPFSHSQATNVPDTAVWFLKAKRVHLDMLAKVLGEIPEELREFWLEIGNGFIRGVPGGRPTGAFSNFFLSPADLADELAKPRARKAMSKDGPKALPFFDLGEAAGVRLAYVLEGEGAGSIVSFDEHRDLVSPTFTGFMDALIENPNSYTEAWAYRFPSSAARGPGN